MMTIGFTGVGKGYMSVGGLSSRDTTRQDESERRDRKNLNGALPGVAIAE